MKKWFSPLRTAWVGVVAHKLRSFLTILGVVIGVAAVITLMSIGKGTSSVILSNFKSLGSNMLFIQPEARLVSSGGVRGTFGVSTAVYTVGGPETGLTVEDANAIAAEIEQIDAVAPSSNVYVQAVAGDENIGAMVIGITPEYQRVFKLELASGGFIDEDHYEGKQKVVVLGSKIKEALFGDDDALGKTIRLGSTIVHVVGVLESKGVSIMGSSDDAIYMPLSTLKQVFMQSRTSRGEHIVQSIAVSVSDQKYTSLVIEEMAGLLRYRHQIASGAEDDFRITSVEELTNSISEATRTLTLLLGAIAAVSLVVGGIGVMNIMLVSVVERTREVGVRKALGAREWEIWSQFVAEAAFMTLTGGVIGIVTGWGVSRIVSHLATLPTLVSADIVVLAVGVSVAIGIFFGFYPAWQASRLDPIQALRHE